jgi:hypothetical protein
MSCERFPSAQSVGPLPRAWIGHRAVAYGFTSIRRLRSNDPYASWRRRHLRPAEVPASNPPPGDVHLAGDGLLLPAVLVFWLRYEYEDGIHYQYLPVSAFSTSICQDLLQRSEENWVPMTEHCEVSSLQFSKVGHKGIFRRQSTIMHITNHMKLMMNSLPTIRH